jgi:hypothetical protein
MSHLVIWLRQGLAAVGVKAHTNHANTMQNTRVAIASQTWFKRNIMKKVIRRGHKRNLMEGSRALDRYHAKKKIIVSIEKSDIGMGYDVLVQTIGYPKTTGFVEGLGDTVGISPYSSALEVAKEVYKETKKANPDALVSLREINYVRAD